VIRTDATRAAAISRIVFSSRPFDRTRIRIERIANQKKVSMGSKTMYSIMKNIAAKILTRN